MQSPQNSRIDLGDLKAQIVKRIGPERSKRYFYYLNRLLSQKLSKSEFDKLCCRVLGREVLPLHNQLIRSILKNACQAKAPPPIHEAGLARSALVTSKSSPSVDDGHEQNGSLHQNQNHNSSIWSNGFLPVSPRKGRSGIRDRKLKDRPSSLGQNGKVESLYHAAGTEDSGSKNIMENGVLTPCDYQRSLHHLHAVAELPEKEREGFIQAQSIKPSEVRMARVEDEEEVEQVRLLSFSQSPLLAPLGIPFCSASIGGVSRAPPVGSSGDFVSYHDLGGLSDSESLRRRMQHIGAAQDLEGVSMECANTLNTMLDVYLKRMIRSCLDLAGAKAGNEPSSHGPHKQPIPSKVLNGVWPTSNHFNMQNSDVFGDGMRGKRSAISISLLDFKAAMELNPQKLGEDWPLLLEKISMRSMEW